MTIKLKDFRESVDGDAGLQSKRKILVVVCIIFLALNLAGASIEEANTFIFKIKFTNTSGISFLFIASIIFLTIRYYSYAQDYHSKLYDFWSWRMMDDHRIFHYDANNDEVVGLLGKAIYIHGAEEPGIRGSKYCVSGFFKRHISFPSSVSNEIGDTHNYIENICLDKYTEHWRPHHYFKMLWFELMYQLEAIFKYREGLDLLAPYFISLAAIISFFCKH